MGISFRSGRNGGAETEREEGQSSEDGDGQLAIEEGPPPIPFPLPISKKNEMTITTVASYFKTANVLFKSHRIS